MKQKNKKINNVFTISFERNRKQKYINVLGENEEEAVKSFWEIVKKDYEKEKEIGKLNNYEADGAEKFFKRYEVLSINKNTTYSVE